MITINQRWVDDEVERGHYSLLRLVLAQRGGSVSATIIREELLQLATAAVQAATVAPLRDRVHAALTAGFDGRGDFGGAPFGLTADGIHACLEGRILCGVDDGAFGSDQLVTCPQCLSVLAASVKP